LNIASTGTLDADTVRYFARMLRCDRGCKLAVGLVLRSTDADLS